MKARLKQLEQDVEEFVFGALEAGFNLCFALLAIYGLVKFAQMIL